MLRFWISRRSLSIAASPKLEVNRKCFEPDEFTNVTPRILEKLNRNLYLRDDNPLSFTRQRIIDYFHSSFKGRTGNAIFSVHEGLDPVVTTYQNFDSLLIPKDHVSRSKSDCYYINKETLLRSHMTAHQSELIKMGLNNFLMVGDVYRRDEIDSSHYPVFHQFDGVRLYTPQELFLESDDGIAELSIMKKDSDLKRSDTYQEIYTEEATKKVEGHLKGTLAGLSRNLFGPDIPLKWSTSYFPFTHPSWELEIYVNDKWMEVLGCGVIEHAILKEAGCENRIGWAFGLGLERLAMILYQIPDIRIFWSENSGFLSQFRGKSHTENITYKAVSKYPQCTNHISFWIPDSYSTNDFYDIVRDIGGDLVEQVYLFDEFTHPKKKTTSHSYEIVYRSMDRTLTQKEVNEIHDKIGKEVALKLNVTIR